jgi:hypothetical protein
MSPTASGRASASPGVSPSMTWDGLVAPPCSPETRRELVESFSWAPPEEPAA